MLSFVTRSYLAYRQEVDYKGFNEAIRVTLESYHQFGMQGASMINLSLSTMLTLTINTLLPLELESAKVQAVERALIGQHLLHTLPSLSISLFLFIRLDPMED